MCELLKGNPFKLTPGNARRTPPIGSLSPEGAPLKAEETEGKIKRKKEWEQETITPEGKQPTQPQNNENIQKKNYQVWTTRIWKIQKIAHNQNLTETSEGRQRKEQGQKTSEIRQRKE